nr:serine/arginine repetitive matrix protein 2 isoform X1 [Parasteatoda tepidariorum]
MKMLKLLWSAILLCAIFGNVVIAQNRGVSRYVPAGTEESEGETAPRIPPRRSSGRRARPSSTAVPKVLDEPENIHVPSHKRDEPTTARHISNRNKQDQPPIPVASSEDIPAPLAPASPDEPYSPASPQDNKQGRRRRQKKRRKPQGPILKSDGEIEKPEQVIPESKTVLEHLDTAEKKPVLATPGARIVASDNHYGSEDISLVNSPVDSLLSHPEVSPYFPPQAGTNRLPLPEADDADNSRSYPEPSEPTRHYSPEQETPKRGSYVPVLAPNRASNQQSSARSSANGYRQEKRREQTIPSTRQSAQRTTSNRSRGQAASNPDEFLRNAGVKPSDNIIAGNEPIIPGRSHGEVRLPPSGQPLISSDYDRVLNDRSSYDTDKIIVPYSLDEKSGEHDTPENPTFREPYDSVPPANFDVDQKSSVEYSAPTASNRGREVAPLTSRNAVLHYSPEEESQRSPRPAPDHKVPEYQPPLQRSNTRYRPEQSDSSTRSKLAHETNSPEVQSRSRGTSRYQPDSEPNSFDQGSTRSSSSHDASRTRSSSRSQAERTEPERSRSRNSSPSSASSSQASPRTRGTSRYQPEETTFDASYEEDTPSRTRSSSRSTSSSQTGPVQNSRTHQPDPEENNYRRSPINPEADVDAEYKSADRVYRQRVPASSDPDVDVPQRQRIRTSHRTRIPVSEEEDEIAPTRQTLRPRPQFEEREPEHLSSDEEILDDRNAFSSEYQEPSHGRRRTPVTREQPEYQSPRQNGAPSREVSEFQAPRQSGPPPRDAPEYQAPRQRAPPPREQPEYQTPRQRTPPPKDAPEYQAPRQRAPPPRDAPEYQAPRQRAPPAARQEIEQRPPRQQPPPRYQPDYQEPQSPRVDRNQANRRQPSPQQPRARPQESATSPNHDERSSGRSRFKCPEPYGFFADHVQCDKYYECRNGTAVENLCNDGLAFNEASAPKYLRCDSLRDVDCNSRPELQKPRPTENCPRRYGLFPHETDCTKFWNCVDGTATEVQCPPGLTYNDERATCDWADLVKTSCKTEDLLGFTCPEGTEFDLQDGVFTRYPHPDNCQLHFTCIKGEDGLRRPRMLSCNEGLVYDPVSSFCARPENVPGCEDFYGSRSPPPKRKPSREPEPREPEEVVEEDPRLRRRNPNRRIRN